MSNEKTHIPKPTQKWTKIYENENNITKTWKGKIKWKRKQRNEHEQWNEKHTNTKTKMKNNMKQNKKQQHKWTRTYKDMKESENENGNKKRKTKRLYFFCFTSVCTWAWLICRPLDAAWILNSLSSWESWSNEFLQTSPRACSKLLEEVQSLAWREC